ncbi:MAG: glucose-6-phosphate isomerase [Aquiluna sp.]|nr:glucose-6-phosphate isomerase [Aquiluna sp.]MCF8545034.1 glucose-6-phosphate isomerase [Aquiluna sp.]
MKLLVAENLQNQLRETVSKLIQSEIASEIAAKNHTLWGPDAESEASIRLGWVESAQTSVDLIADILLQRDKFHVAGINRFVLCGMGGSSLAPEVITKTSGVELVVLDSTAPDQVKSALIDLDRTAVVVSSKSGSTVETDSQKRAFEAAFRNAGINPLDRIVIVTDPGSPLDQTSRETGYKVYNADPNVGGRYSALTAFGLVPSGFAGADISQLLSSASNAGAALSSDSEDNPALWLGAAMARSQAAVGFKDKFLIETDELSGFGDWVEQLVAESTGKLGRGILPVVVSRNAPEVAAVPQDTLLIRFGSALSATDDIVFSGDLGELFLLWEYATAIAGNLMQINPFDQPNVESAKIAARTLLDSPMGKSYPDVVYHAMELNSYGFEIRGDTLDAAAEQLLKDVQEDSYISLQVYLNRNAYPQMEALRDVLAKRTGRPVTFGWGPRFLHSTGQYHKGGPLQGIFIQITQDFSSDLEIEGRPFSFGTLIGAQAQGDAKVLADNGSKVLSIKLTNPLEDLEELKQVFAS